MTLGPNGHITINITSGTIVKAVFILVLAYVLYLLRDLVLIMLTAVVIASSVEPATKWFARYRVPRVPAVITVYILAALVLFGILYFFIPPLLSESSAFLSQLPNYIESLNVESSALQQIQLGGSGESAPGVLAEGDAGAAFSLRDIVLSLRDAAAQLSGGVLQTVSAIFGGVLSFVLIVIFSFYLSVQERGIDNFLRVVTPVEHEDYVIGLWHRAQAKIGRWMQGQFLLVIIIGILTFLGLTVLGVRHALLLAVIAGFFELIPLFGPILAAIPAVGIAFIDGGATVGLLVVGLYIIIQQFENHLIYPLVVHRVVGVPALLVIIALIVGAQLAGFLGILLSVPVAAFLQELAADVQHEKRLHLERKQQAQ